MSNAVLTTKDQRRRRTRAKISGTAERPRLNVYISNRHIMAQLIDDENSQTLAGVSTVKAAVKGTLTEKAVWVGEQIAAAAKKQKLKSVVFDRGHRIYHGRLHALAEAARAQGLEF
jgi:large subunit ribosomal protein L18